MMDFRNDETVLADDSPRCGMCGSSALYSLGILSTRWYYRCRDCGMDGHETVPETDPTEDIGADVRADVFSDQPDEGAEDRMTVFTFEDKMLCLRDLTYTEDEIALRTTITFSSGGGDLNIHCRRPAELRELAYHALDLARKIERTKTL